MGFLDWPFLYVVTETTFATLLRSWIDPGEICLLLLEFLELREGSGAKNFWRLVLVGRYWLSENVCLFTRPPLKLLLPSNESPGFL